MGFKRIEHPCIQEAMQPCTASCTFAASAGSAPSLARHTERRFAVFCGGRRLSRLSVFVSSGWIRVEGLIPAVLGNALRRNIRVLKPTVTTL